LRLSIRLQPRTWPDTGFIPLVKTAMTILAGFTLTKKGLFPPAASRGASHLSMVRLPPICIHLTPKNESWVCRANLFLPRLISYRFIFFFLSFWDLQTIGLPCLLFASVVPAFNSDNIKFLGPLCLSAIVYQFSGLVSTFQVDRHAHTSSLSIRDGWTGVKLNGVKRSLMRCNCDVLVDPGVDHPGGILRTG